MNNYEKKVLDSIARLKTSIQDLKKEKEILGIQASELQEAISALNLSLNQIESQYTIDALKKVIEEKDNELGKINFKISNKNTRHAELREKLKFIQYSICPHEKTTYVDTDYHKREDNYRCDICGADL